MSVIKIVYLDFDGVLHPSSPNNQALFSRAALLALDDSYWEFPTNCSELIRCNPNTGIGPKEVAQLSSWLSNESI